MGLPPRQVLRRGVADHAAVVCPVRRHRAAAASRGRRPAVHQHVLGQAARRRPERQRARRRGGGPQGRQEGWQRVRKRRKGILHAQ